MKVNCFFVSNQHFSFKYFLKIALFREISPKYSCGLSCYSHERANGQSNQKRQNLSIGDVVRKIFEGEMLIRTFFTTLLQIFCKFILNFQVIVKSFLDPDITCNRNSEAGMG